jgi:hypothetical protein
VRHQLLVPLQGREACQVLAVILAASYPVHRCRQLLL